MSFYSQTFLDFQETNKFCLNLSGKTTLSILLNTINRHRTMAGNGLHVEANCKNLGPS